MACEPEQAAVDAALIEKNARLAAYQAAVAVVAEKQAQAAAALALYADAEATYQAAVVLLQQCQTGGGQAP